MYLRNLQFECTYIPLYRHGNRVLSLHPNATRVGAEYAAVIYIFTSAVVDINDTGSPDVINGVKDENHCRRERFFHGDQGGHHQEGAPLAG